MCFGFLLPVMLVPLIQSIWRELKSTLNQGELQAATIELKNALQQNAGNAKARSLLGKLYLETGNAPAAEKELRHASELGDADDVVLPLLAQALLAQGKLEELQAIIAGKPDDQ